MLIYEKNNKLNINFDNEVSEQPDLQISKEDGKTSVKIDGQESGGGGGVFIVHVTNDGILDKTYSEIVEAQQKNVVILLGMQNANNVYYLGSTDYIQDEQKYQVEFNSISGGRVSYNLFSTATENGYPQSIS